MTLKKYAGLTFAFLATVVFLFQIALALGAPWGSIAMSGVYPGQLPTELRVAALVQAFIWALFGATVISRTRLALSRWTNASRKLAWIVVAITGISSILNLLTPSSSERMIWAPVAILMFICSLIAAKADKNQDPPP